MEEGAKRRLVGAAVMVALLVIFLPMLLEEETRGPVSEQEMAIPPRPDFDSGFDSSVADKPVDPSLSGMSPDQAPPAPDAPGSQELPPPVFFDAPASIEPEILHDQQPEAEPGLEGEADAEPEPEPEIFSAEPPAAVEEAPATPKPPPKAKSPKVREQPPAPTPPRSSSSTATWVIQVAASRERERAYSLVQKLRAKNFPAYIEEAVIKQQLWYRVRVGPEIGRKQIEEMAAALKAQTGLGAQIQPYP